MPAKILKHYHECNSRCIPEENIHTFCILSEPHRDINAVERKYIQRLKTDFLSIKETHEYDLEQVKAHVFIPPGRLPEIDDTWKVFTVTVKGVLV